MQKHSLLNSIAVHTLIVLHRLPSCISIGSSLLYHTW